MAKTEKTAVRQLQQREDVEKALEQSAPGEREREPSARSPRVWLFVEAALLVTLGALTYLVGTDRVSVPGSPFGIVPKLPLASLLIVSVLFALRLAETYGIRRMSNRVSRYNLTRIFRLVALLLILGFIGSIVFSNLYTSLVSLASSL
jgi:hypothetical protein